MSRRKEGRKRKQKKKKKGGGTRKVPQTLAATEEDFSFGKATWQ